MKRIKYFWHYLIPIILYFPYRILSDKGILVDVFGCGCLKYREPPDDVNMLGNQINANAVNFYFWTGLALIVIIISILNSLKIHNKKKKIVYLIFSVIISIGISVYFYNQIPHWR